MNKYIPELPKSSDTGYVSVNAQLFLKGIDVGKFIQSIDLYVIEMNKTNKSINKATGFITVITGLLTIVTGILQLTLRYA